MQDRESIMGFTKKTLIFIVQGTQETSEKYQSLSKTNVRYFISTDIGIRYEGNKILDIFLYLV
jgi:hypothetical protein